ncbi:uncharacterized protein MELLADRAFT_86757 [Melampsora larici-populina 98AG31]|uniref:Uncharacterized protein n=1 Tax=Melampsora larici-populina (strain 98AG31 / pathotype 3-4-7) TaxID=747676 RepID=F4R3A5_MELLP|nr:uncharacterized protein MELLADRAFT_86757 [Melampsora larici-populina 98AG31]EGG12595.1 hypothetical protein MELLADRAFT_86757 [Melampsora larici-populina 98AG31]
MPRVRHATSENTHATTQRLNATLSPFDSNKSTLDMIKIPGSVIDQASFTIANRF